MSSSRDQKCDDLLWRSIMEQEKTMRVNWYFKYHAQQDQEDKDYQNSIRQMKPKPFTSEKSLPPIEQINRQLSDLIRNKDYKRSVYWTLPVVLKKTPNPQMTPHSTAGMYQVEQSLEKTLYDKALSSISQIQTLNQTVQMMRTDRFKENVFLSKLGSLHVSTLWLHPPDIPVAGYWYLVLVLGRFYLPQLQVSFS